MFISKVAARRIISGKWGCNNGQACVAPDYIITTKDYAPKLVRIPTFEVINIIRYAGTDPVHLFISGAFFSR